MPIFLTHIVQPEKGAIMLQHCSDCCSTQILVNEYAAKPQEGDAWVIEQCCISHRKLHQPFKLRPAKPCEISSADPIAVAGTETTRLEKKLFNILELFHDTVPRLSSLHFPPRRKPPNRYAARNTLRRERRIKGLSSTIRIFKDMATSKNALAGGGPCLAGSGRLQAKDSCTFIRPCGV